VKLRQDRSAEVAAAFAGAGADGSGAIDASELKSMCCELGVVLSIGKATTKLNQLAGGDSQLRMK